MNFQKHTDSIKSIAHSLGFSFCGISKAEFLSDEAPKLEEWLKRNYQGEMHYLENHFDKRLDPTLLVPGAKSVISLVYNYYPKNDLNNELKIARYAYGEDYHNVIKEKLAAFMNRIREEVGEVNGRVFVDSAPVMERAWAQRSGIGWVGKNSLLLNRTMGSFFFLAEIIVDLELEYDGPMKDYCGSCTACVDACPTDAIAEPYVVDGSKCISYFTIELKGAIGDKQDPSKFNNWIFGCDICQEVCPWNRFSKPNDEPRFAPREELNMTTNQWREITNDVFERIFEKSAVKRTKFDGLKRNIEFVLKTTTEQHNKEQENRRGEF